MASNGEDSPLHRRNQSETAIPLQTLYPNGLQEPSGPSRNGSHRRTLSDRGRALFRSSRQSVSDRSRRYSPIGEGSPSPPQQQRAPAPPRLFVSSETGEHARIPDEDDEASFSPVSDRGAFQSAITFAGLSFNAQPDSPDGADDDVDETPPRPSRSSRATRESLPRLSTSNNSVGDMVSVTLDDGPAFFSPGVVDEEDTLPLTDPEGARGSSLAPVTPQGQGHDRRNRSGSNLSVRFTSLHHSSRRSGSGSRLGDDLPNLEAGGHSSPRGSTSPSSRKRSLSPAADSPLARTGTMLRKMSQRVVNLSNEPELVEREIRRKSSLKHVQDDIPPVPVIRHDAQLRMDGSRTPPRSPVSEKAPSPVVERPMPEPEPEPEPEPQFPAELPDRYYNPLRGKSLGIFTPQSRLRRWLLDILVLPATEPLILLLIVIQAVILAVDSAADVNEHPRPKTWGRSWTDYTLMGIFVIYTIETIVKIIVSGFILNPVEYSTIDRRVGLRKALTKKANTLFALQRKPSMRSSQTALHADEAPPSLLRSFTVQTYDDVPGGSRQAAKKRLAHRAYLRHSFNRLDFVAVVSFWVSFMLGAMGIEWGDRVYVFRMMSCLRILRLLNITSGTSVILRSLKRAAPTLLNVAFLIGFFWLLFAIIGVQSFKSSLRRTCVWDGNNANPSQENYTMSQDNGNAQYCGGWMAANGSSMPWLSADGGWGTSKHKGYLCPVGSYCVEGDNPYNGTVSFDNIGNSLEMVFVIMTSNTFTDIMYYLTDSDYLAAALFSAFGIIIMSLWLMNLLIAVITSSFQVIREESRSSAFMATEVDPTEDEGLAAADSKRRMSGLKRVYDKSKWLWIAVIVFGLVVQSLRNSTMHSYTAALIDAVELAVTLILLGEIIIRFLCDWRDFLHHRRNWIDLGLAIITTIIQIPAIHDSGAPYAWLSVFQIMRIYRVVLAVEITRDLILLVLRHVSGIANLILFVFLLTFLAAIFASQLFRGTLPLEDGGEALEVSFFTIYNSFLGMYQLLSSENWTSILYNVTSYNNSWDTAWIGAAFLIIWYILANFIVLNMFIAVIQENFDVSEDQKRMQQVRMFLQQKELGSSSSHGMLSLSTIFKFGNARRQDPLDFGSAATDMLLKDAVVRDFLDDIDEEEETTPANKLKRFSTMNLGTTKPGFWTGIWAKTGGRLFRSDPNPFYAPLQLTKPYEELDPRTLAREVMDATEKRKITQREYLHQHPKYNNTLCMFSPDNRLRRICQRIVGPGRGTERIQGVAPNPNIWYAFSVFIYAAIVAMVLLACVTTPLYQREYFSAPNHAFSVRNWFVYSDIGFAALFTVEAIIKVIADGFFFTPNAYYRSSWGFIDGVVLVTLWANVFTSLYDPGSGSRAVGAFKALRALRLLNVSDSARDTFHQLIVLGIWKLVSAALVSLSLLIPFAIYGLNLFAGQMQSCNDGSSNIFNLNDCVGEYMESPQQWDILMPRTVRNPYYDFDSFGGSLFILFQIVSQEGWIDVQWSAQSITGVFTQPNDFATQGNAVFFVIFNLLGSVFVLTLFVSVFMRNYTEQTGVAFLTTDQRSWLELRKLLRQVSPSKRPSGSKKKQAWQDWCYRRAITKNGRWQRGITVVLTIHLILLCLEFYPEKRGWVLTRTYIFLIFNLIYIANIVIRVIGLSWTRFRKSAWDVYSVFSIGGTFVTTILLLSNLQNRIFVQTHKLFLVSVALLLIPRNNQLDQLFKTAAASLTSIVNLLATWFVLFLVYAIALTQTFGLTRFGEGESGNINFRTVPKALILLFRMSMGEGWNETMEDFAGVVVPFCTAGEKYIDGDCGSAEWARALFISWNILSMYIFVNLFISLIYESFSYVYQRSSGLSIISREEIRRFKEAWAVFDPNGYGYISKEVFPKFLGELSGVFEMRIYDGDYSVSEIMRKCAPDDALGRTSSLPLDGASIRGKREIDIKKLNRVLDELPVDEIRRRRERMNTFYEEVLVSADPDRGIAFSALLMILAHYKVINDSKSLKLEEFLRRRARLQRVEEAVNRNIVVGFFDTLYWSRRFRRAINSKKSARMTAVPSFGVPEIFVQDEEGDDVTKADKFNVPSVSVTPVDHDPSDTAESSGIGRAPVASGSDLATHGPTLHELDGTASGMRNRSSSIQQSPVASPRGSIQGSPHLSATHRPTTSSGNIQPDWHFAAALESAASGVSPPVSPRLTATSVSDGNRSRANSAVSQHEMMDMFGSSAWGESMRRSATQRRVSDNRRPGGS